MEHDLHVRMHPFQAPQHPLGRLVLGRFSRSAQDKSDVLWSAPLSLELIDGASTFYLPCGCVAMD